MLTAILATVGCGGERGTGAPTAPDRTIAPAAQAYLNELIALMEAHSLNRLKIDWNGFRTDVMNAAGAAQSVQATFPAIRTALVLLGDGHSRYEPLTGAAITGNPRRCGGPIVAAPTLPTTVGYVRVPSFSGSPDEARALANALHRTIAGSDRDNLAGWVVDLRGNLGGNMWPMIAGVGPILGEGVAGYFIDPVGAESWWGYRNGASWLGGSLMQRVDAPHPLRRESPRVAVLIDRGTASSGEAVLIAFQRRPATRSFGTATCGLSTAVVQFVMSDGASLWLTVSAMADRTKFLYGEQILPDEEVLNARETEERAVAWLHGR